MTMGSRWNRFDAWKVLENFQVTQRPIVPKDAKQCTIKILQRDFAFSYGLAEVVEYTPPLDCGEPGSWAAITLNFTVTSNGTQYDRLGHFTFQNVEIWRTSTPEPTRGDGIIWTYIKDDGTFILQLDNLIQTGLDGVYATVLHATFYASSEENPPAKTSDLIVPLLNVTLPQNTVQIFAELYASGNSQEEFWVRYTCLPDTTYGQGPFREVRLLVDGIVAGTVFPYITIFTGGFVPAVWRPISSYGALDLPTYFLDLTPFAPIFADGKPHLITLDVVSAEDDHAVLQNWYLSGLLQVFTDPSGLPTTGTLRQAVEPYALTETSGEVAENGNVVVTVTASRKLNIEATVVSGSGEVNEVSWSQVLEYKNTQYYLNGALEQSRSDSVSTGKTDFDHSYDRDLLPQPIQLRSSIKTQQIASNYHHIPSLSSSSPLTHSTSPGGYYTIASTGNFGNGTNNNTFAYSDADGNTYSRRVNAAYNVITLDEIEGTLAEPTVSSLGVEQAPLGTEESFGSVVRVPGPAK
ncbi:peptide N-acetyl-beta-D-glucosaminyl asparaginase amidase A-domain-containing protein [Ephemerocybe angulata]|uniref:Peptide N-acetyl-beta-D-glucosaminyl asparaginase amidase A-domain-containing protein n=1 Tax=Ephemerocybe angulata TaxID=980116 RepID=A0A8H6M8V2_9AGAR|nr:peptide N-acetyl-beta-D-glucosaminyl asparaginase amidase A-domain-containing protein [Tulosesus angulatus]